MARLEQIREEWKPEIEFTYVYILEAHPEDRRQVPRAQAGKAFDAIFDQPTAMAERMDLAERFVERMEVETRTLVDDMANTANACYAGWPDRIYVIDKGGTVAYKGGMGPFLFAPDELEDFLAERYSALRGGGAATDG